MGSGESSRKTPVLTVLLLLLTSLSPLAIGDTTNDVSVPEKPTIFVEGLPTLICENGESFLPLTEGLARGSHIHLIEITMGWMIAYSEYWLENMNLSAPLQSKVQMVV